MQHVNLNKNLQGLSLSSTLKIKQACRQRLATGQPVYDFGLGASPFPVPDVMVNALKAHAHEREYLPSRGLVPLTESVSAHILKTRQVRYDPKNIVVGPGSKELLFLLNIGFSGEIWIVAPAWVSYEPQAKIAGHNKIVRCITSAEDRWKLTPQLLEAYLENYTPVRTAPFSRLIILNYPANPHGSSYTKEELAELAKIFRREQFIVLSDEIYANMRYDGAHTSIAQLYPEATIMCDGISKWCGAGGWRLGVVAIPNALSWLADALEVIASESFSSTCAPVQFAAISAFEPSPEITEYTEHVRRILKAVMYAATDILKAGGFEIDYPDGAYYLFVDCSIFKDKLNALGVLTGEQLANYLMMSEGIAALPGSDFGLPESSLTLRLSIVDFDGKEALEVSKRTGLDAPLTGAFMKKHFSHCFDGLHKLISLLK